MRILGRLVLISVGALAVLALVIVLFRNPIAEAGLRMAMTRAGLEAPALEVEEVSFSALEIGALRAGAAPDGPQLKIERAKAGFNWRALFFKREIETLEIGPGAARGRLNSDGSIEIAGLRIRPNAAGASREPPVFVKALDVEAFEARLTGDEGAARVSLSGRFEPEAGGAFRAEASAAQFAAGPVRLGDFDLEADVRLRADGALRLVANARSDLSSVAGAVDDLDLYAEATGFSWRLPLGDGAVPPDGRVLLDIRSGEIAADAAPELSALAAAEAQATGRPAISKLAVSGGFTASIDGSAIRVLAGEGPALTLRTDREDVLTIAGVDGAPLFEIDGERRRIGLAAALAGAAAAGSARLVASGAAGEQWNYDLTADLLDPSFRDVALGATALQAAGRTDGDRVLGDVNLATTLKRARLGRLRISEAPFAARLRVEAALAGREFVVAAREGGCLELDGARFELEYQEMRASLDGARLCADGAGRLLRYNWSRPRNVVVAGVLSARSGDFQWGATSLQGAPPKFRFRADYDPAAHRTEVAGEVSGGRVVLNRAFEISEPAGTFAATLDRAALGADVDLARVTVAQAKKTKEIAPLRARANGRVADDVFSFGYGLSTFDGAAVGSGEGAHEILTGKGAARFRSADLAFAPGGLQPDDLLPVLKGIVWRARGEASATADFAWSPDEGVRSSAAMNLAGLSFRGPGVAVSETAGLDGEVSLVSLSPPATRRPQSISIERVDLGALILEDGEVLFELPGDQTLHVISAAFPWFGGEIGAYDTIAAMTGAQATTRLEAKNVDLGQLLAFWEIEGLSGEGVVEGVLPLVIEDGKARIRRGRLSAVGPGVIRYAGDATSAAAGANAQAAIAFEILRNLRFETLEAEINGPLDGDLTFDLLFEGVNEIPLDDPRVREPLSAPIIYRIRLNAPLLTLLNNSRNAVDPQFLLEQVRSLSVEGEIVERAGGDKR